MFRVPSIPLAYSDPWALSLADRMRMLRRHERRVAYYYHVPDNSTFRYRCYSMVQAINEHIDGTSAAWFCAADGVRLLEVASEVECLVVCRSKYTAELAQVITVARQSGARVLFDCDDLVFDPTYVTHIIQTLDVYERQDGHLERMWDTWFAYIGRLRESLLHCDGLIVTNEYLANRARESVDLPIHVVPNFMCNEQVEYSREIVRRRELTGNARNEYLDIGYFSGTPTHNKDFAIASGALARLLGRHPFVRVRVAGYLNLRDSDLGGFPDRVDFHPFVDFLNLQRVIGQTEVNVAPLQDNIFANCKSELKYFDAAAVAVPTLASPTFSMSRAIVDQATGLVVQDDGWDDALETIVDDYETLGLQMGRAAFEDAHQRYVAREHAPAIYAALLREQPAYVKGEPRREKEEGVT